MGIFLLCSFLMIILYPVGIDLYLVAVPQIAQTLQASEAQIHTAFSIYLFGMAATVLLGGIIADRHGRRWVVLGGTLIFVVASLVAGNAAGIRQFYLGRFWQGVGAGARHIMTFTVLRDVVGQARLGMGFPEVLAFGPDHTLYRFSVLGGAPSLAVAFRCPARLPKAGPADGAE